VRLFEPRGLLTEQPAFLFVCMESKRQRRYLQGVGDNGADAPTPYECSSKFPLLPRLERQQNEAVVVQIELIE